MANRRPAPREGPISLRRRCLRWPPNPDLLLHPSLIRMAIKVLYASRSTSPTFSSTPQWLIQFFLHFFLKGMGFLKCIYISLNLSLTAFIYWSCQNTSPLIWTIIYAPKNLTIKILFLVFNCNKKIQTEIICALLIILHVIPILDKLMKIVLYLKPHAGGQRYFKACLHIYICFSIWLTNEQTQIITICILATVTS